MSDGQQFWYSVEVEGAPAPARFGYVQQDGTTVVSVYALELKDGRWQEVRDPSNLPTQLEVTNFRAGGCQLVIVSGIPILETDQLTLVFKTTVDFAQPLPLDKLSLKDSSYEVTLGPPPPETTTYAVLKVTPTTPPKPPTT